MRLYKPFLFVFVIEVIYRLIADMPIVLLKIPVLSLMCGNLWFLQVIMGLYLLTSVFMSVFKNSRIRVMMTFIAVGVYIMIAHYGNLSSFYYNCVLCFPLGMLLANIKSAHMKRYDMLIICAVPFLVGSILAIIADSFALRLLGMMVSSTAFSLLILVLAPAKFGRHLFSYVGANSLIVYIAQMFLCAYLRPNTPGAFVLYFILILFVITISYKFIEQSWRNYKSERV